HALSEKEKKFLAANMKGVVKILLAETGREADERLVPDSEVTLTCLNTIVPILAGEGDPVMAAIAEGEAALSGSSMGTVLDVRNEAVGPVPAKKERTPTPRGSGERRLGVPVELRALAPNPSGLFLPPREWEAFVAKILKSVITINASSTANKEGCFLTTACVEARGLADDCAELTTLRAFRDGYMRAQPAGRAMIEEYYRIAPAIVRRMKASPRYPQEIAALYDRLVAPAVALVQAGRNTEALRLYAAEVRRLQARHLGGGRQAAQPAPAVPPGCRMAAGELDRPPLHPLGGAQRLAAHAPTRRRRGRRGATEFLTESAKAPTVM
ncbi:MAG TPA: CFI-box-CTERM domain-containing protein, partial [Longimicrobiaceae bacterium]|nr:CFI-box-CTERM domain-containing protein [Longimicrobiaceae bacterium]